MGFFNNNNGSGSSVDEEIRNACDSDIFTNIVKVIDNDKDKYKKVISYLSEQDNLSMKLRIMSLPVAEENDLMSALMNLEPSDGEKIDRLCKDEFNPTLHFCIFEGMEIFIRLLAHANADLDVVGFQGATPLIVACENGRTETVKMLINNGAKAINKCDDAGYTPLHYACQLGYPEMVETLVNAGADVNALGTNNLMPIHVAIMTAQAARMSPTSPSGHPWSVEGAMNCFVFLANHGADLDYVCSRGFSARTFRNMIAKWQAYKDEGRTEEK